MYVDDQTITCKLVPCSFDDAWLRLRPRDSAAMLSEDEPACMRSSIIITTRLIETSNHPPATPDTAIQTTTRLLSYSFTHSQHNTNLTMGWFGGSSSPPAPPPPAPSQDGGFIAPDRSARAVCWDGRDSFFKCLDRNNIVDSVRDDKKAREVCAPELREFESACASSWVSTWILGEKKLSRRSESYADCGTGHILQEAKSNGAPA